MQAHFCHIPGDHTIGLNCLSDSQVLPLLLAMDADTLLTCARASTRLLGLVRDREVWRHLLRETDELTKEKVEELVLFGSRKIPEMMAEVLKETASRMSRLSNDPYKKKDGHGNVKIVLSVQGWGSPSVYQVYGDHLEKLVHVANTVGSSFTIVEVEHGRGALRFALWKQIAAHVKHQGETLDKLDFGFLIFMDRPHDLGIDGIDNVFLYLVKMSKWWRVKELRMWCNRDNNWATLASNASAGRIGIVHVYAPRCFEEAKREDVRKVWEISSVMRVIFPPGPYPEADEYEVENVEEVGKDQPGEPEANWQKLVEIAGLAES